MATATRQQAPGDLSSVLFGRNIEGKRTRMPARREDHVAVVTHIRPIAYTTLSVSLQELEGEDAKLTGGTRSLRRRLLALNVKGSLRRTGDSTMSHTSLAQSA